MTLTALAAAAMVAAALVHSLIGERRLLAPLLAGLEPQDFAVRAARFAWHATAVLMLLCVAAVAWPATPHGLVLLIGGGWLGTGLVNAAYLRLRHPMWLLLAGAGILTIAGAL